MVRIGVVRRVATVGNTPALSPRASTDAYGTLTVATSQPSRTEAPARFFSQSFACGVKGFVVKREYPPRR
jgi:hypothetical protein